MKRKIGDWMNNSQFISEGEWQVTQDYLSAEHKRTDLCSLLHKGKFIACNLSKRQALAMANALNSQPALLEACQYVLAHFTANDMEEEDSYLGILCRAALKKAGAQ